MRRAMKREMNAEGVRKLRLEQMKNIDRRREECRRAKEAKARAEESKAMKLRFLELFKIQAERDDHREQEVKEHLRVEEEHHQKEAECQAILRAEETDRKKAEELLCWEEAQYREMPKINPMSRKTNVGEY